MLICIMQATPPVLGLVSSILFAMQCNIHTQFYSLGIQYLWRLIHTEFGSHTAGSATQFLDFLACETGLLWLL